MRMPGIQELPACFGSRQTRFECLLHCDHKKLCDDFVRWKIKTKERYKDVNKKRRKEKDDGGS